MDTVLAGEDRTLHLRSTVCVEVDGDAPTTTANLHAAQTQQEDGEDTWVPIGDHRHALVKKEGG